MRVFRPPRSVAKANGMSSLEGARFVRRAISITTGRNSEATPMSFMNPESTPTVSMMIVSKRTSPSPAKRSTRWPISPATPVRASAPLRMSTAQTVITAGLLKPDRASAGLTNPVSAKLTNTNRATTSMRTRSVIKSTMAIPRMARTIAISAVIY